MCFQPYKEKAELDLHTVYSYIEELSFIGTKYVQFSGGEPLSYTQLPQVIRFSDKGLENLHFKLNTIKEKEIQLLKILSTEIYKILNGDQQKTDISNQVLLNNIYKNHSDFNNFMKELYKYNVI